MRDVYFATQILRTPSQKPWEVEVTATEGSADGTWDSVSVNLGGFNGIRITLPKEEAIALADALRAALGAFGVADEVSKAA